MVNKQKQKQASDVRGAVAFGSGLAATLLLLAAFQGSVPALLLAYLSPLPLMIATIGFGHVTGLGAVLAGFITLVALLVAANPQDVSVATFAGAGVNGILFLICEGLPSWWLARVASVSRSMPILPFLPEPPPDTVEEGSRLSLVIVTAAAFAFLVVGGTLATMVLGHEDFAALVDKVAANIRPVLKQEAGADLLHANAIDSFARFLATALPAIAASVIFVIYLVNLWLAGRVAQISQRLQVPWPNVAREFRVPRLLALVFVAAAGLIFAGGAIGLVASLAASVLGVAFALQGLAVIHVVTLGLRLRNNLLFLVYLFVVPLMPWSLAPFTLLGLLEAGFSLRDRKDSVAISPKMN
ncbi:MAG: DUF2232 domain-containing protein [Methylovirgula sp.]|uniref:DUF2232 domain-containing protein n=1 Tax=Methylovirgula sp. TaxID=1978224 RepID=UPI0030765CA9